MRRAGRTPCPPTMPTVLSGNNLLLPNALIVAARDAINRRYRLLVVFVSAKPEPQSLTVAVFLLFLSVYIPYLYTGTGSDRPDVSIATVLEWLVVIGIMGWVLVASATWWRYGRGSRNTA